MTKRLKRVPSALSGLRQAEPPKDLGELGNANDRAVTSAGAHIRLAPHAKIHKFFYRNLWPRHQAIWALEVGRDAWILSGKIKALPVKYIDLLAANIGYSADELGLLGAV